MELLPLLIPSPDEPALLPGERRRLLLTEPRMLTAVRLALRAERRLVFLAFDPGQPRLGDDGVPDADKLLPVGTACELLEAEIEGELGFAVVRGTSRVVPEGTSSGGCCDHDDPYKDG